MALTDLTRISTAGIATGTSLSGAILHGDAHFRGTNAGINSAIFDSSEDELNLKDNVKLTFGNAGTSDSQFYFDSNNLIIQETSASGSMLLRGQNIRLQNASQSNENYIECLGDNANRRVKIYQGATTRFETTSTGVKVTGILTATSFSGPVVGNAYNASGISTFYDLRVSNNLTVEGTTTTLDTNLIGVDRIEVGADSDTVVGVAITQSGTADIFNLYDGSTEVFSVADGGGVRATAAITAHDFRSGSGVGNTLYLTSADDWRFRTTGGAEKLRITSTGEVRIPTGSNSTSRLTFGGGINIYHDGNMKFENSTGYLKLMSSNATYIDGSSVYLRNSSGTERLRITDSETFFNHPGSDTNFRIRTPAQTHMFYVDAGNNQVSIKTSSAQSGAVLTVNGRTHLEQLTLGNNSTLDAGAQATIYKPATNTLAFATAGANERLRITSDGKFSLGTINTTPSAGVHIDIETNNLLMLDNSTGATQKMFFAQDGATHAQIFATSASGRLTLESDPSNNHNGSFIDFRVDNSEKLRINENGQVGIGTGDPLAKLAVGRVTGGYMNMTGIKVNRPHSLGLQNGILVYTDNSYNATASYRAAAFKAVGAGGNAFAASTDQGSNGLGGTLNARIGFDGGAYFLSRVGIGTNSPDQKLTVFDGAQPCLQSGGTTFRVDQNASNWNNLTNNTGPILAWDYKNGPGDLMYMGSGGNTPISGQMALVISDAHGFKVGKSGYDGTDFDVDSSNEYFRITTSGKVNIGGDYTNTTSTLRVIGDSNAGSQTYLEKSSGSTNNTYNSVLTLSSRSTGSAAANYGPGVTFQHAFGGSNYAGSLITSQCNSDVNTANLSFYPRNYGWTEALRIHNDGKVSIGYSIDTAPWGATGNVNTGVRLVNGTGGYAISANSKEIVAIFNRTNTGGTIVECKYNGSVVGEIKTDATDLELKSSNDLKLTANGGDIIATGKLGVGLSNPTHTIEAEGANSSIAVHYSANSRGGLCAMSNQRLAFASTHVNDDLVFGYSGNPLSAGSFTERMRIDNGNGQVTIKNYTTDNAEAPYLLFHNRGNDTTDNSNVYNMGGIAAAGYRDVANPSIVAAIQFERQITANGASSGGNIVFRTGFNGTTSHTQISKQVIIDYSGNLYPADDDDVNLGLSSKRWKNLYTADAHFSNIGTGGNEVDGTEGSWTLQEAEDSIYMINRKNGKRYKIKMEEV